MVSAAVPVSGLPASAPPPNVLLVLVDDMGVHQLGCYGNAFYETPCLDGLARESVRFTQAYGASPVCSPSRAALYTGRHPARLHLTNYIPGTEPPVPRLLTPPWRPYLPVEEVTFGDALKARGYATGHFGKWHLALDYDYQPGRPTDPESQGFDEVMVTRKPRSEADPERDAHHVDQITECAIRFISAPRAQPFLCVVAHNALHRPEMAPAALVAHFAAKPGAHHDDNRPVLAAMMAEVDRAVGRLLDTLRATGRVRDTLVIFTSDHGAMGRSSSRKPLRGAKADLYEGGLRVPLLVRLPGQGRAAIEAGATQGADVFNTILEAAGVPVPAGGDGVSLLPACRGSGPRAAPRTLFWHFPHYHHLGVAPSGALRSGRWKLIEWFERTVGGAVDGPPFELYDLENDPGETHNLAAAQPEVCADLARQLAAWRRAVGAQEMQPNPRFDAKAGGQLAPPPSGDPLNPYGE
jgi:arylsulfatase A-like enzyme